LATTSGGEFSAPEGVRRILFFIYEKQRVTAMSFNNIPAL
jgi:hypothetical protein